MVDTQFNDVSEFQPVMRPGYEFRGISLRSNDGTYRDQHFPANYTRARKLLDTGRLDFLIVYFVYETNIDQTVDVHQQMCGRPHPLMASMIDMESWRGRITGDQSVKANHAVDRLARWYGDRNRVIAYFNAGDGAALWPHRRGIKVILADYDKNPAYPNKIAHQYRDDYPSATFGHCDINSADGKSVAEFQAELGLRKVTTQVTRARTTVSAAAGALGISAAALIALNPGHHSTDVLPAGTKLTIPARVTNRPSTGVAGHQGSAPTHRPAATHPKPKPTPKPTPTPKHAPKHAPKPTPVSRTSTPTHTHRPGAHRAPTRTVSVRPGQNLWQLAADHGLTLAQLLAYNPSYRSHPDLIHPRDVLTVPR